MSTSIIENIKLKGVELFFSISQNQKNKPIILYLHGGPGDACIPLTKKFNSDLEESFIFVNLEQRGCGLSYYQFSKEENLTIQVMLDDIHQFVLYLLERLKQDKLILMGHSWGTVLGLLFIKKYPELVSQYIGIGQVVNMKKNMQYQKDFLKETMRHTNAIDRLDFTNDPISSSLSLTKKIVSYGGSVMGSRNYRSLIVPFIFSKDYTVKNLVHRLQGANQSILFFWEELLAINFENDLTFKVPIIFCEGRHDHHVSSELVSEYSKMITSKTQIIWFEQSAHFPQWEEAAKFNQVIQSIIYP